MCIFARWSETLGRPREGVHAARIPGVDVALWDVVGTIVGGLLIAWVTGWSVWATVACAFVAGVVAHLLFCIQTRANTWLFGQK
jgi:hypothetical protein